VIATFLSKGNNNKYQDKRSK